MTPPSCGYGGVTRAGAYTAGDIHSLEIARMNRLARSTLAVLSLAAASLAFPVLARAADGYVTGNVNLRAGPDPSYPLIDLIPAGTEIDVLGCTDGWEWCDVIAYGNRGWIAGNYVEYFYQDRPVLLPAYGAQIGIPIITFVISTYWDSHYRGRPFYRERDRWYHRPVVRRPPPPPMRHPYRPPVRASNDHRPAGNDRPQLPVSPQPRPYNDNRQKRPATMQRPPASPRGDNTARPVRQTRPEAHGGNPASQQGNRPSNAARGQPTRSGHAKPKSADKKNDHGNHDGH
jgi:uncharacterized protein YraI